MRRILFFLMALMLGGLFLAVQQTPFYAQSSTQSRQGDPPIASLITVSPPDSRGNVTISGAAGAVFPGAQVAIRNLYTGQVTYTNANVNGVFSATLFATGSTPFWVSAAVNIPPELRNLPGSLPGGPGTIIYSTTIDAQTRTITQLTMDGDLDDWQAYPQAASPTGDSFSLRNPASIYMAVDNPLLANPYDRLRLGFALDQDLYNITVNPNQLRVATIRQSAPVVRERQIAVNAGVGDSTFELRLPLELAVREPQVVRLTGIQLLDAENAVINEIPLDVVVPLVLESDGAVYPDGRLNAESTSFYVAGALAQGASYWTASGRITTLKPSPGETLTLDLDVTLLTPNLPLSTTDLTMLGDLTLQPVSAAALHTNNGWSNLLTRSGLAIDNVRGDVSLGQTSADWTYITRLSDRLIFGLRFHVTIPENLPPGIYVPVFKGSVQTPDGAVTDWTANGLFGSGNGISRLPLTRLPLTLNVGEQADNHLYWVLFHDRPSNGSRGILADEDAGKAALSNRVKFNSPTYILPPGSYPVEPYIPDFLPNAYDISTTPLVPLLFPGGRLSFEITRPDGTKDSPGSLAVVQNRLSTEELDERTRFGAQSPVDVYRLTTLNPLFTAYNFNLYGEYKINLTGQVEDKFGNRYSGGGTYHLLIAEQMDLVPGVLPGTPFEVGDNLYAGLHLNPGLPADVTVTVRVFPLNSPEVIEQTFSGTANSFGHYSPDASFTFETPGEYIIDYEARYTDASGKLWAASLRSAGVIGKPDSTLIAHGERGLDGYQPTDEARPAWFTIREYPKRAGAPVLPRLFYPYHSGDLAYYEDSANSGIRPLLQVQDLQGDFAAWLQTTRSTDSLPLKVLAGAEAEGLSPVLLPDTIVNESYGYISAVRPGVSVRQFVHGDDTEILPFQWDANDPLNGQIGVGNTGDKTGDYVFLFGGAIVHNEELGLDESTTYAALAVTGFIEGDALNVRVYPPFRGADGGALFRAAGVDYTTFFHPTGVQPGQVMLLREKLAIAGQVAPTLPSQVTVSVTSPSGKLTEFSGTTSKTGYFYNPANDFEVNEVGVWSVTISVSPLGVTSAGVLEAPLPVGGVPGAVNRQFNIYVTRPNTEPLSWNRIGDINDQTPAAALFNFTMNVPPGLTDVRAYRTITMPGYILEDGSIPATSTVVPHQYSPPQLALKFPSLETLSRGNDASASDVVKVTFAVVGVNDAGAVQVFTRTFTFFHNRIISFEGE